MAKQDKEYMARMQGMTYALRLVKEGGTERLEKDIRMRNFIHAPLQYDTKQMQAFYQEISKNVYTNMMSAFFYALHERFGFGEKRLLELKEEFDKTVQYALDLDYMGQHYVELKDFAIELNSKYNLGIDVDRIAACQDAFDEKENQIRTCKVDRVLEVLRNAGYDTAAEFLTSKLD